ncbi:hypothetical protein EZJ49_02700 [Bdellovibrio bacteriovorus]|uniref:hypothetical protein n=1 Tax=Bdellovibrio bacteriovorus TaxID=959 RepID=UPI0021D177A7|nr:hypothetical protein [Bdellovibrio bacteriovorus]UXR65156.1 hypothetical protein EZJ49_02700 [Bdellovibrio bacteriovorus]
MRLLAVLAIVTVSFSVMRAQASLSEANKVWKEFRACSKRTPQDVFTSCASGYLASGLVAPEKNQLLQLLDIGYEFTGLQDCTGQNKIQPTKIKSEFYCMELKGKKKNGEGYVAFVKEMDGLKIQTIKFKY